MKLSKNKDLKFIDLFAGIGGFHQAAHQHGLTCVFASEIDQAAKDVYESNYGITVTGDITKVDEASVPKHDMLFAGFPCQPFSKGGMRKGFEDARGTLFHDIVRILNHHKPKYFILENVQNLVGHDGGNTYKVITNTLRKIGYSIPETPLILSPDQFGVPALRKRIYIPGVLKEYGDYAELFNSLLKNKPSENLSAYDVIENTYNKNKDLRVSEYEEKVIQMWNEFYLGIDVKVIGFPVWADYFVTDEDVSSYPKWKKDFIQKNADLYFRNKKFIDAWLTKYDNLEWVSKTHRKFEWQAGTSVKNIYDTLIQFRPSGVRVKVPNRYSTLVAMNHAQIVGKYLRRLHPNEAKKLQSFPPEFNLHEDKNVALKQLGNAVNVTVIKNILDIMLTDKK